MNRPVAALALATACAVPAAAAPGRFDGTWSVEILTDSGGCDRAYRYPIRIEAGAARIVGTPFVVEGRVAANGAIRGTISNGSATAAVRGRLGANGFGTGTWVASGSLQCRGHWNAERRG